MEQVATQFASVIGEVGFPIGAFYLMYHMSNNSIKEVKTALDELRVPILSIKKKKEGQDND